MSGKIALITNTSDRLTADEKQSGAGRDVVDSPLRRLEGGEITPVEALRLLFRLDQVSARPKKRDFPGRGDDSLDDGPGAEGGAPNLADGTEGRTSGATAPRSPQGADPEWEVRRARVEAVFRKFDALVGLSAVKKLIHEVYAYAEIQRLRRRAGLKADPVVLHMVFKGNPGTGKTTVARLIGELFRETGLLAKGHLVEVERADLVGEYIGHTAQKTREQIKKAMGGVLFVDEAYSLARGGDKDFGKEAIDTLVKAMEDRREEFVVILAGYRHEMEWFLSTNPGLMSRFALHIDFPDYTTSELTKIAELMAAERQYTLDAGARAMLSAILASYRGKYGLHQDSFGNARTVRNLIEAAVRRQATRLLAQPGRKKVSRSPTREELMLLTAADIDEASQTLVPPGQGTSLTAALAASAREEALRLQQMTQQITGPRGAGPWLEQTASAG